jgi:hypothetical protein
VRADCVTPRGTAGRWYPPFSLLDQSVDWVGPAGGLLVVGVPVR